MVKFAELENASDRMIDEILETVDRATLATALQGANARLVERVLGGRSPEMIDQVLSHIQRRQTVSLAEVESARQQIAEMAEALEAAGIPVWDPAAGNE